MKDLKIFIETMTFCQGNCQGCFFSRDERVSGNLISIEKFSHTVKHLQSYIEKMKNKENTVLDITLVLGQGDHLSVDLGELSLFLSQLIPLKSYNPLIIFSTSALIKNDDLNHKIKYIRDFSREHGLRIIPAVVLDIKKFKHDGFTQRYQQNLSNLRESFGILDLVINLGKDTIENFSTDEFVSFIEKNAIRHVEFNLVPTLQTLDLFSDNVWIGIIEWLVDLAKVQKNTKIFHEYNFLQKTRERNIDVSDIRTLLPILIQSLGTHIYIDSSLNVSPAGFGFVGNAVPYHHKNGHSKFIPVSDILNYDRLVEFYAKKAITNYMQDKNCGSCQFLSVCVDSGVDAMRKLKKVTLDDCDFASKRLFSVIESSSNQNCTSKMPVDQKITNKDVVIKGEEYFGVDEKTDIKI